MKSNKTVRNIITKILGILFMCAQMSSYTMDDSDAHSSSASDDFVLIERDEISRLSHDLLEAVKAKRSEVVIDLLKNPKVDVNYIDTASKSALHYAVENENSLIVHLLLIHGANILAGSGSVPSARRKSVTRHFSWGPPRGTPYCTAMESGNTEIIALFNRRSIYDELCLAIATQNPKIVESLCRSHAEHLEALVSSYELNLMYLAIDYNCPHIVEIFMDRGISAQMHLPIASYHVSPEGIITRDPSSRRAIIEPAIHYAIRKERYELAGKMLVNLDDLLIINEPTKQSILHLLCLKGQVDLIHTFFAEIARRGTYFDNPHTIVNYVNLADIMGNTALYYTLNSKVFYSDNPLRDIPLLLANGANQNTDIKSLRSPENIAPVIWAAKLQRWDIVNMLITDTTDVTKIDPETGRNLLHLAADDNQLALTRLLINRGVSKFRRDKLGRTPLFYAKGPAIKEIITGPPTEVYFNQLALVSAYEGSEGTTIEDKLMPCIEELINPLKKSPAFLMVSGPYGSGKTQLYNAICTHTRKLLIEQGQSPEKLGVQELRGSRLLSEGRDRAAKLIKDECTSLRDSYPFSILFIDELQELAGGTATEDGGHAATYSALFTELLMETAGADHGTKGKLMIIGATSNPEKIGEALIRRASPHIRMPSFDTLGDKIELLITCLRTRPAYRLSDEDLPRILETFDLKPDTAVTPRLMVFALDQAQRFADYYSTDTYGTLTSEILIRAIRVVLDLDDGVRASARPIPRLDADS
jgi:ankyrin repeat protein